jgi:hypothetical protein
LILDDSFIKISNSLGLINFNLSKLFNIIDKNDRSSYVIKDEIVNLLETRLYESWKQKLLLYIQEIELYDISLNMTDLNNNYNYFNKNKNIHVHDNNNSILIVTYLIKLDPRIQQNTEIIYKIINIINETLIDNDSKIYDSLSKNIKSLNPLQVVNLNIFQLSCKTVYFY